MRIIDLISVTDMGVREQVLIAMYFHITLRLIEHLNRCQLPVMLTIHFQPTADDIIKIDRNAG